MSPNGRRQGLEGAAPFRAVINSVFGRLCRKTAPRGREDTRVWYRETMFSCHGSYDFPLHGPLHEYFSNLVSDVSDVLMSAFRALASFKKHAFLNFQLA